MKKLSSRALSLLVLILFAGSFIYGAVLAKQIA